MSQTLIRQTCIAAIKETRKQDPLASRMQIAEAQIEALTLLLKSADQNNKPKSNTTKSNTTKSNTTNIDAIDIDAIKKKLAELYLRYYLAKESVSCVLPSTSNNNSDTTKTDNNLNTNQNESNNCSTSDKNKKKTRKSFADFITWAQAKNSWGNEKNNSNKTRPTEHHLSQAVKTSLCYADPKRYAPDNASPFSLLPVVLLQEISLYLPNKDLTAFGLSAQEIDKALFPYLVTRLHITPEMLPKGTLAELLQKKEVELKRLRHLIVNELKNITGNDCQKLNNLKHLKFLIIKHSNIGNDGFKAIAENTTLTELYLNENRIGADGAKALAENTTLIKLDLSHNRIGDDGAKALAENTTLTKLYLRRNQIGDDGAEALAENTTLTELYLGWNDIGDDGAKALAENTTLTKLYLNENQIGADGAKALAENTTLTTLDLSYNKIGVEGGKELLEALKQNTSLIELRLEFCDIGQETLEAINKILERNRHAHKAENCTQPSAHMRHSNSSFVGDYFTYILPQEIHDNLLIR